MRKQVQSLRTIISGLQAKSKERQWMKNQTQGELDDMRLIEGITGEKSIYKKRGEQVRNRVARWQNLIPSFPWIAPWWRVWGRNPRKGRDQILQRSVAEP